MEYDSPHGFHQIRADQVQRLVGELTSSGVIAFSVGPVADAESFFHEAVLKLPMNPPLGGRAHWDAFVDSLWNGIDDLDVDEAAILWALPSLMRTSHPEDYEMVADCLAQVVSQFHEEAAAGGRTVELRIYLIE